MQDQVEANRSGLRVLEEVLWESNRGKQKATEGGARVEVPQAFSAALYAHEPSYHSHYVPAVWACGGFLVLVDISCFDSPSSSSWYAAATLDAHCPAGGVADPTLMVSCGGFGDMG